ncbi:MAG: lamin tail domain-containing protein [Myxococcales bacterium]
MTTVAQTGNTAYTVSVEATVKDTLGKGIDAAANTANFTGFSVAVGCSPKVVISQLYGGGGSGTGMYKYDFVELHNRGSTAQDLTGWSLQYGSATSAGMSSTWTLSGSIDAGKYLLIQCGSAGTGGVDITPTPDVNTCTLNIGGTNGKVALVKNATALTACPSLPDTNVVDLVGFGTASCRAGTAAGALSTSTSAIRNTSGCDNTYNNLADFTVGAPAARNSTTAAVTCGCD